MTTPDHPAGDGPKPSTAERCLTNALQACRRALDELDAEPASGMARERVGVALIVTERALAEVRGR